MENLINTESLHQWPYLCSQLSSQLVSSRTNRKLQFWDKQGGWKVLPPSPVYTELCLQKNKHRETSFSLLFLCTLCSDCSACSHHGHLRPPDRAQLFIGALVKKYSSQGFVGDSCFSNLAFILHSASGFILLGMSFLYELFFFILSYISGVFLLPQTWHWQPFCVFLRCLRGLMVQYSCWTFRNFFHATEMSAVVRPWSWLCEAWKAPVVLLSLKAAEWVNGL